MSKYGKSGPGAGGSKLGPKYKKTSTVKTPKNAKAKTTTRSDYKAPTAAGSKACGSTRSGYGDKGAGKTRTKSSYKTPKAAGSK
jgi:hypothetical protein